MSLDDFLVDLLEEDVLVDGADFRQISQILENAYYKLKAKDEQIKQQKEMIAYLKAKCESTPPKVDIKPLIHKFKAYA